MRKPPLIPSFFMIALLLALNGYAHAEPVIDNEDEIVLEVNVEESIDEADENNSEVQAPSLKRRLNEPWVERIKTTNSSLEIIEGNSHVARFNRRITRVAISDPAVADVVITQGNEILVNSKKRGSANVIIWDEHGDILVYSLTVVGDPTVLRQAIQSIKPGNDFSIFSTQDGYVVKGNVDTVQAQNQIADAAKAFSKESVSLVTVDESKQILLEIRFIEISLSKGIEFGIDGHYIAEKLGFTFLGGSTGADVLSGTGGLTVDRGITAFPQLDLSEATNNVLGTFAYQTRTQAIGTALKALEDESILKLIARPNLLVRDSQEASFLVGGEFPIPTVTQNTVDITYREFGTRLTYTPEILERDRIRLTIETEVSQLDFANGVTVNNFLIPALSSRRTESSVELKDGQSLSISGLIQQRKSNIESGTPLLRRIPVLGRLFETTSNDYSEVELMIIVTPHIIDQDLDAIKIDNIEDIMEARVSKVNKQHAEMAQTMAQDMPSGDDAFYQLVNEVLFNGKSVPAKT